MTADFKDQILSSKAKLNQPVKDFLGPNGVFSKAIANFKVRKGQLLMAENWQDTIQNGEVLVCEAGTGTGKRHDFGHRGSGVGQRAGFVEHHRIGVGHRFHEAAALDGNMVSAAFPHGRKHGDGHGKLQRTGEVARRVAAAKAALC